jgi:hypothetical protein
LVGDTDRQPGARARPSLLMASVEQQFQLPVCRILPCMVRGDLNSMPNASFAKVSDGYAVTQELTGVAWAARVSSTRSRQADSGEDRSIVRLAVKRPSRSGYAKLVATHASIWERNTYRA